VLKRSSGRLFQFRSLERLCSEADKYPEEKKRSTTSAVLEFALFIQGTSPTSFGAEYLLFGQVKLTYH